MEAVPELFQGAVCTPTSDLAGWRSAIRGKIYLVPADVPALLRRYEKDFPEHRRK